MLIKTKIKCNFVIDLLQNVNNLQNAETRTYIWVFQNTGCLEF